MMSFEDFNIEGIREPAKPLFSIPTHAFRFNAGKIDKQFYINSLQLEKSEYNLIRSPQRGVCLYKCGITRAEVVMILARMSGDDLSGCKASSFPNVSTDSWYFAAVSKAAQGSPALLKK